LDSSAALIVRVHRRTAFVNDNHDHVHVRADFTMTQRKRSACTGHSDASRLRVVRHDSDLGFWESTSREPDARLRELIEGPYQGWVEKMTGGMLRREVPSGIVPMIINLGPAYGLIDPTGQTQPRYLGSFVAGMHDSFALTQSPGFATCLQVNLKPLGARQLLNVPMHSLANCVIELEDVLGITARHLAERMQDVSDWESRFQILDAFIALRLAKAKSPPPGICWAWRQLNETGGLIGARSLAAELGCSHKHLITQFRREIGLPPKTLARILRFSRVTEALSRNRVESWAQIAHLCGYYDQAHLIRDFREFAGSTPGEYLGRVLPDGGGIAGD
jgi:AraC-like DNA-binding protein